METVFDITIIGGGIVGLATALALSERKQTRLLILEAESRVAAHQTGNNSGVIHSGLYYKPGSLKAENCVKGRQAMYAFCEKHDIRHEKCGKLVVAVNEAEIPALDELERRGKANGLEGLRRLSGEELNEYEPHVRGIAGLHVSETGIVDFVQVCETFASIIQSRGHEINTSTAFRKIRNEDNVLILETNRGRIRTRNLINCAGLQSDRVARMCGVQPGLKIIPFRGEYYKLKPEKYHLVNNLIYPVPDPQFPFLGVHFTRMVDNSVEAGPNAVLAFKREGYHKVSFSLKDTLDTFLYPGFIKLAGTYMKMGLGEFYRSFNKAAFVRALRKLIPEISRDDIVPGGAGIRAQALEAKGQLVDDFRILEHHNQIHVLNAPSPAATAAISIGETIAGLAQKNFNIPGKK